jgi:hypothetical protein
LEESPLLKGKFVDFKRKPSYLEDQIAHLSHENRQTLRKLYNAFPEWNDFGIINTNSYGLGPDGALCGVFELLSRVNHSCRPNAERCWDADREVETLYALRDIQVGQELTVLYTDVEEMTRGERQLALREGWRFDCTCECCAITEADAQSMSDQRRTVIRNFHQQVSSRRVYETATTAYKYANEEGLRGSPLAYICGFAYRTALRLRNVEDAEKWVARYHAEYLLSTGPSSCWTKSTFELVKKPTTHEDWNPLHNEVASLNSDMSN